MLNLKEAYLEGNKGFTLIELVLAISLFGILMLSMFSLLYFTENITNKGDEMDTTLFNGRYAMEYIKAELRSADRIIPSCKFHGLDFEFPHNIGFVSVEEIIKFNKDGGIGSVTYNYRTYYQKNDELIRVAYNSSEKPNLDVSEFSGHNQICNGIIDIGDCNLDSKNNLINLSLNLKQGDGSLKLETIIKLKCLVE